MRCREARTALRRCPGQRARVLVIWFSAIAVVAPGAGRCHADDQRGPRRGMCARPTAGGRRRVHRWRQSTVHRARRRVLGVVSAEGSAYKITTKPNGVTADLQAGDGGSAARIVQRTCGEPVTGADRQKLDQPDVSGCPHRIQDPQRDGRVPARLWREPPTCWPQGANSSYMKMLGVGDGGGQERPRVGRRRGGPV